MGSATQAAMASRIKKQGRTMVGNLRRGYVIHQGDQLIQGPDQVSLNEKSARLYLHMMDNREEIQEFFGWPKDRKFLSLEDQIKETQEVMKRLRGQTGPGSSTPVPVSTEVIQEEVERQTADLRNQVQQMRAALMEMGVEVPALAQAPSTKSEDAE